MNKVIVLILTFLGVIVILFTSDYLFLSGQDDSDNVDRNSEDRLSVLNELYSIEEELMLLGVVIDTYTEKNLLEKEGREHE